MADEFNTGTNWWDSSRTAAGSSSSLSGLNNSLGSYGNWPNEGTTRSSMDNSVSSVSGSSVVFHESNPKLQSMDLQMMGLGLSSQAMDWNHQALLRGEKGSESSFRSMLQDHNYHHHQHQQQQQQQMNRGFSLDQFSPHGSSSDSTVTGQSLPSSFQMDSTALYASPSTILQGLLGSDQNQPQQQQQSSINYQYGAMNTNEQLLPNSWSKVPQFLRNSPPKQQQQNQLHGQLHFSNNAPFWNPSAGAAASMVDHQARPGFYPSFQTGNFDEKPKNISEVRDTSTVVKKSGNEPASNKRTRNETPSTTMPAFKVRKEKMGDRITALQQLVSPFGKTDTASVLSEAIEYIKFLHEQVSVLSTPYMKNDQAAIQHQQHNLEKSKDPEGPKQDLRSTGLCLVPVSSTFPLTHDSPVDFWTPTFGGTFR